MPTGPTRPLRRKDHTPSIADLAKPRRHGFWRDQFGGVSMMYAAVLPVLIGLVGLGVETGYWYYGNVRSRRRPTPVPLAASGKSHGVAPTRSRPRPPTKQYAMASPTRH
jgi:hypothetical protein